MAGKAPAERYLRSAEDGEPIPCFLYARISKDVALEEGMRTDRQLDRLQKWAEREGRVVLGVFVDDDLSASTYAKKVRPDYQRMLRAIRLGELPRGGEVCAVEVTRITRSGKHAVELRELLLDRGINPHTLRDGLYDLRTAKGKKRYADETNEAEYESALISERVTNARAYDRADGRWLGGKRTYGYDIVPQDDKRGATLRINPEEQEIVKTRMVLPLLAGTPLSAIARSLNADGIPTRDGKRWASNTISRLLSSGTIASRMTDPATGKVYRGSWNPLLDADTYAAVTAALRVNRERKTRTPRKNLLTGLVYGACGTVAVGARGGNGPKSVYDRSLRFYKAPGAQVLADDLEDVVTETALRWSDAHALPLPDAHPDAGYAETVAVKRAALAEVEREADEAGLEGVAYVRAVRQATAELQEAERNAVTVMADTYATAAAVLSAPGGLRFWWERNTDLAARRQMLSYLFLRVEIYGRHAAYSRETGRRFRIVWAERVPAALREMPLAA